jgi:ArsR family transcriptional regulator
MSKRGPIRAAGRKKQVASIPEADIERYAELLKALANPARLRLVSILAQGEWTVSELCRLSGLKQSLVSQQLKILRLNNVVQRRKEVSKSFYSLKERNVVSMLDCLGRCRITKEAR